MEILWKILLKEFMLQQICRFHLVTERKCKRIKNAQKTFKTLFWTSIVRSIYVLCPGGIDLQLSDFAKIIVYLSPFVQNLATNIFTRFWHEQYILNLGKIIKKYMSRIYLVMLCSLPHGLLKVILAWKYFPLNPFHATDLFLHPVETTKSLSFSDVFKGYRKRPVAWNGLKTERNTWKLPAILLRIF